MRNNRLNLLNPYIGKWKTEGLTKSGDIIAGTDIYEWVDGGFFLTHRVDILFGNKNVQSLEITHYDDMEDVFRSQSFDNAGCISISTLKIYDDIILIFADKERFKGNFKANTIEGIWEQFDGKKLGALDGYKVDEDRTLNTMKNLDENLQGYGKISKRFFVTLSLTDSIESSSSRL